MIRKYLFAAAALGCAALPAQLAFAQGPAATQPEHPQPPPPPVQGPAPSYPGSANPPSPPPAAPAAPVVVPAVPVAPAPGAPPYGTAPSVEGPVYQPPAGAPPAPVEEARARLDYSDGSFYLRSRGDKLVATLGGRAHIDVYTFAGDGADHYQRGNGTGLKPNLLFRRFIFETGGIVRGKFFYWLGGNFGPSAVGDNEIVAVNAGVYDGFVGYIINPQTRIYFGQYNQPFTMENTTSSRWLDMMERALVVRTLATPYNKADGLTLWGATEHNHLEYQIGGYGGDGQNRPNIDDRFDASGRVIVRPLASRSDALKRAHIGGGARYGRRDAHYVRYDAPNLSTPGGYAFWSASYGSGANETHVLPSRQQMAFAGEAYIPFERFDLRGEFVYLNEDRREVLASDRTSSIRGGTLKGFGTYAQASIWLAGVPRINGNPAGAYGMLKVPNDIGPENPYALQLVLRGEALRLEYDSNSRFGATKGGLDSKTNDIKVNVYQAALNYWYTKHIRLTAEYSLYQFPGTPSSAATGANNQAAAPGVKGGAPGANTLHEVSFRVGLAI